MNASTLEYLEWSFNLHCFFAESPRKRKKYRAEIATPGETHRVAKSADNPESNSPVTAKILGSTLLASSTSLQNAEIEDGDSKNKKKKARTTFTGRQIFELEKQFEMKKYLSSSERSEMAKLLNVTETQVSNFL